MATMDELLATIEACTDEHELVRVWRTRRAALMAGPRADLELAWSAVLVRASKLYGTAALSAVRARVKTAINAADADALRGSL